MAVVVVEVSIGVLQESQKNIRMERADGNDMGEAKRTALKNGWQSR